MLFRHIQAHSGQLLLKLPGGGAAVVGQKQVGLALLLKPVEELRDAGQNLVTVVNDAVHIADKAFFLLKIYGIHDNFLLFSTAVRRQRRGAASAPTGGQSPPLREVYQILRRRASGASDRPLSKPSNTFLRNL